jgi:SAM-dependent methyltransferase
MGQPTTADPDRELVWAQTWTQEDWTAQRSFIEPFNTGRGPQKYGALVIRGWLEDHAATPEAERRKCDIWLRAAAGAGKTTLMSRHFFELIGAASDEGERRRAIPEPMLIQPRNGDSSSQPAQLRASSDDPNAAFATFIRFWLANRRVDVPAQDLPALVGDFKDAMIRGDLVLLIDGHDDQRRMGLGPFLGWLRATAQCWVAAERDDPDAPGGGDREVNLADAWSLTEIKAHLERRWPPTHRLHGKLSAVAKVLETETALGHWLRVPRSLDLFLAELEQEGVPHDDALRRRCRGEADFLRSLYRRAVTKLRDDDAMEHRISERLSRIAESQVLGKQDALNPAGPDDRVWHQVARLGDIVDRVLIDGEDRLRFKSPAFRDFFFAGRIAFQLAQSESAPTPRAGDRWSRSLLAGVADWLHELNCGPDRVAAWIALESAPRTSRPSANLLNLVLRMQLDLLMRNRPGESEWDLRRDVRITNADLRDTDLTDADLRLFRFEGCRFDRATLVNTELAHAAFHGCRFTGADLSQADAIGAEFLDCVFRGPDGAALRVAGLEIEATEFGGSSDVGAADLVAQGASLTHSRYRGAFGRLFLNAQESFLGPDLTRLETGAYRERIREALGRVPPDRPAYLIDLMAGGGSERLAGLLGRDDGSWPNLHVLGVDRDDPSLRALKREFPYRFEGRQWEIDSGPDGGLDLDLGALLGDAFGGPRLAADVIIAKKAIHEIARRLQPALLAECCRALRPGGRFVLFADTPGGLEGSMTEAQFTWLDRTIRPLLVDQDTPSARVRDLVLQPSFTGSVADRALFTNLWILLKDWANENGHEVEHRYFASAAEIEGWARAAGLVPEPPAPGRYTIAVALFNETGIRHAMHHLERTGVDQADENALRDWLGAAGQPRFALLREFTEHHLADGTELATALGASTEEIGFERVHPRLQGIRERSRAFRLPFHVLSFRRPAEAPPAEAPPAEDAPARAG